MSESGNSSQVSLTPTFSENKFSKPTWKVLINNIEVKDAILERVDIGYGSDLSTASFTLPRNPLLTNPVPQEFDDVEVIVNSKTIFKGFISVKSDHVGSDGLKISYTALSNIANLHDTTVLNGDFNTDPSGIGSSDFPNALFTSKGILNIIGVHPTNTPNSYPGAVNITDKNLLEATESVLAKVGNYKLYYDMVLGSLDVYEFGSGGINTRSFIPGKNIINYSINKSTENLVDKIIVVGSRIQTTTRTPVSFPNIAVSPGGREELMFTLSGINIRDITVEGQTRQQPQIVYDQSIVANRKMLQPDLSDSEINSEIEALLNAKFDTFNTSASNSQVNNDLELRPKIKSVSTYTTEWTQIPITIVPHTNTKNTVDVFISEIPKIWKHHTISGDPLKTTLGLSTTDPDEKTHVEILDELFFDTGNIRVTYTSDGFKPTVIVGSGRIVRSITDSQYQIITNSVTGENNSGFITTSMQIRAQAEYARLHLPQITGTITVLGDETIDLRQTIFLENQKLDIIHVTHSFTNGYTTDVSLTNERFIPNIILRPPVQRNYETEKDKRKGLLITLQDAEITKQKNQQTKSEKKKEDDPPQSSSFVYR